MSPRWHWRSLTPEQEQAVRSAHAKGASLSELAGCYGVTTRTIARTLRRAARVSHRLTLGNFVATFELDEDGQPIQTSPWLPVLPKRAAA